MIAELYNKVSTDNLNLSEKSEDELTGNFFESMRYIPFDKGLKRVMAECIRPKKLLEYIEPISETEWSNNIEFWKKVKVEDRYTEFDVVIEFENLLIGVEVKYLSDLSSDDDIDNSDGDEQISYNQLSREARALNHISKEKSKLLILLADELSCNRIYQNVKKRKIISGVELGYISWQNVLISLKNSQDLNPYEQVITKDLIQLLDKKGFKRFENFQIDTSVERNNCWVFNGKVDIKFNFNIENNVRRGEYYEFR